MAEARDLNPGRFLLTLSSSQASHRRRTKLKPVSQFLPRDAVSKGEIRVVASRPEYGFDLVEMRPELAAEAGAKCMKVRIEPELSFRPAVIQPRTTATSFSTAAMGRSTRLDLLVHDKDGSPVRGARVDAFYDYAEGEGTSGVSNDTGRVTLRLDRAPKIERLKVEAPGYWDTEFRYNITPEPGLILMIAPLDARTDCLRHFYADAPDGAGDGVKIGVIDTGIDLHHPDLEVKGGRNTVEHEDPLDYGCNGNPHGTHVAGIIAGRGRWPGGIRGLAPAAAIYSYRVYGQDIVRVGDALINEPRSEAKASAIAEAIGRAVDDGCDLINLSLEGPVAQPATSGLDDLAIAAAPSVVAAIHQAADRARGLGALVIAAAGNGHRGGVTYPALDPSIVAVSAMGRVGTFPPDIGDEFAVGDPRGSSDRDNFVAAFTCVGDKVALTAPGVGIISTVSVGGYRAFSGTSMACAAVTGVAARLLASSNILKRKRDRGRSAAIDRLLSEAAELLNFGPQYEGRGLIRLH